ncbi:MAG: ABC transporter ATP-binding protein [Ferruginibacter sp.]|nr:ABC transporter ATP-binding protein [Ferruginibacter sp.]
MNILEVEGLQSEELLGGFALDNINFSILPMQKVALMGQTGSGKSTLSKTIAGFIQHKNGTIHFNGKKVLGPNFQLVAGEKGIAYLSQHFELRNNYRMEELFEYANEEFTSEEANTLFELCKVNHLFKRKSTELSGGEKQRVALTRLLLTKPQLLILDEPFSNLDNIHKSILKKVVEDVATQFNITCLLCSHEASDILSWADEILVMQQGKIIQKGSTKEVYTNPKSEYVAALLGDFVKVDSDFKKYFELDISLHYLRPTNFLISHSGKYKGIVTTCSYFGTHYKIEVQVQHFVIVMHNATSFSIGMEIYFEIV